MRAASTRPTAKGPPAESSASQAVVVLYIPPPADATSVEVHSQRNALELNELKPTAY